MGSHSASPNTAVLRTLSTVCATYELVTHVTHVTQATKIPVETKPSEVELLRVELLNVEQELEQFRAAADADAQAIATVFIESENAAMLVMEQVAQLKQDVQERDAQVRTLSEALAEQAQIEALDVHSASSQDKSVEVAQLQAKLLRAEQELKESREAADTDAKDIAAVFVEAENASLLVLQEMHEYQQQVSCQLLPIVQCCQLLSVLLLFLVLDCPVQSAVSATELLSPLSVRCLCH